MDTLRFEHLMRIAASNVPAPEDVVKEMASKFYDRYTMIAKGFTALAATILTALILPWFGQGKDFLQFEIAWYCVLVCLACGLLALLRAVQYSRRYADTLRIVDKLRSIRPLLQWRGY